MVTEFKVEPNAANVAGPLVGGDRIEAEHRVVKHREHAVLHRDAGGLTGWRDLDGGRFAAVVLYHGRHGHDGITEFASLKGAAVSLPFDLWRVEHRFPSAHGLPNAIIDLDEAERGEVETCTHTCADAETVEHRRRKTLRSGIEIELQVDGTVFVGVDVPQFDDIARQTGHGLSVLVVDDVVIYVKNINLQRCRQRSFRFKGQQSVAVGVVLATEGGRCHSTNRHAGRLWEEVSKTEVVNVPARHVVVDVHGRTARVVHDEADLNILIDVVGQVNSKR